MLTKYLLNEVIYVFYLPLKAVGCFSDKANFLYPLLIKYCLNWHIALKSPFCGGEPSGDNIKIYETVPFDSFLDVAGGYFAWEIVDC